MSDKETSEIQCAIKRIQAYEFSLERNKRRLTDDEKNTELVNLLGNALTNIEMGTKEKIKQYFQGASIEVLAPSEIPKS